VASRTQPRLREPCREAVAAAISRNRTGCKESSRDVATGREVRTEGVVVDHVGVAFDDLVELHEQLREAPLEVAEEAVGQRRHLLTQASRHVEKVVTLVAQGTQEVSDRSDIVLQAEKHQPALAR
jgi:hypothetical protein